MFLLFVFEQLFYWADQSLREERHFLHRPWEQLSMAQSPSEVRKTSMHLEMGTGYDWLYTGA